MRADFRYRVVLGYDDEQMVVAGVTFDSLQRARQYVGPAVETAKRASRLRQVRVQRSVAPLTGTMRELPTAGLWVTETHCDRQVIARIRAQQAARSKRVLRQGRAGRARQGWAYLTTAAVVALVWLTIVLVQTGGQFAQLAQAAQPVAVTAEIPENPERASGSEVFLAAMAAGDQAETSQTSGSRVSKSATAPGSDQK